MRPLPHRTRLGAGVLLAAALISCRQQDAESRGPKPDQASHVQPAASPPAAAGAVLPDHQQLPSATSPQRARLKEELISCWCGRNSSRTCKRYAERWREACAPPSDDFLCEPRQRKVLGDARPPAPNVETAVCAALESRSGTQEERWADARTSPAALGVAVFPDTREVRQSIQSWGRDFTHTLTTCAARLVVLLPAQYCDNVDDIFATLDAAALEQRCLPEFSTADRSVDACKAKLLRPEVCAEVETQVRALCNETPNEPYCPRPVGLDCSLQ